MLKQTLLLSIHPEHAENIFSGIKKAELRKVRPRLSKGDHVYVYVSSPRKELIGAFEVSHIISDNPNSLWHQVKEYAALTKERFNEYYHNASMGYAIVIEKIWLLNNSISLEQLRRKLPGFCPPQGYRYLKKSDIQRIESLV
jgi:predicted transcriptional regulator